MRAPIRQCLFQRDPDPASPDFRFSSLLRLNFLTIPIGDGTHNLTYQPLAAVIIISRFTTTHPSFGAFMRPLFLSFFIWVLLLSRL